MKYGLGLALPLALAAAACGNELGECDMQAAQQLVYGPGSAVATKGQALVHESCGQGAFCHSARATNGLRRGAPHGMNFDMLPNPAGLKDILDLAEGCWEQIDKKSMPPKGYAVGDSLWTYSRAHRTDEPRLPKITTGEGKGIVRNWLACGAPVVSDSKLPEWAQATGSLDAVWSEIHPKLIKERCATGGCHDKGTAAAELDMTEACAARAALLSGKSAQCNQTRVVPGDESSMLLDKISNDHPKCGESRMPTVGSLADNEVEALRKWIVDGAKAPDCN